MSVDRTEVNTDLTALVERFGVLLTEGDDSALNDLTHTVSDFIDERRAREPVVRNWLSVVVDIDNPDQRYVMPWRSPTLAWQFIAGRADRAGEPGTVGIEIMHYTQTGELGSVTGDHATYSVEELTNTD